MDGQISWVLQLRVKDGKLEEFRGVMEEMVASTRAEPGTLSYEWYADDDGTTVHVYERYADDAATLAHVAAFGRDFASRFLDVVQPTGYTVYGNPGPDVRTALDSMGATYMGELGGFVR